MIKKPSLVDFLIDAMYNEYNSIIHQNRHMQGGFPLNKDFQFNPDDNTVRFGAANSLNESGNVFDAYQNDRYPGSVKSPTEGISDVEAGFDTQRDPMWNDSESTQSNAIDQSFGQVESICEPVRTAQPAPAASKKATDNKAKNHKKGGVGSKLIATLLILAAVTVCAIVYLNTHAFFGSLFGKHNIYTTDTTEINLSGSDYSSYSQLSKLDSLEEIDLTNSSVADLSDLYGCKKLKKVILGDRVLTAQSCIEFYKHLPEAHLVCKVDIAGNIYNSETTELKVESADEKTQKLYAALGHLERLDLTECQVSDSAFRELSEALPNCLIVAHITLNETEYTTDAEVITLKNSLSADDVKHLALFKNLRVIDARECDTPDLLNDFLSSHPDVRLNQPFNLLGKKVGTEDELVDLRGNSYTLDQVMEALDEALPKMHSLKKIDMCGCGLSDADMETLCAAYPDIKFVWMIHFVKWYVRTDAVIFSTLNSIGQSVYTQYDYAPLLKYCNDLVALDLGHSRITDISGVASMKKLRAVILTDNKITDISAFAELKDLEFIEMNATNKIKSLEPLRTLQNLRFIDIWASNEATDLSPLYNHEKLEIAIFHKTVPEDERNRFIRSNPNCATFFKVDSRKITTNSTWRSNPYRLKLKAAFSRKDAGIFMHWKYIVGFDEKTEEFIVDYNTDQYGYK